MLQNISGNLKDILIKMVDPAEGAFKPRADNKAIARMLARVIDVKGNKALLRWPGGRFSANLETPVFKGEQLLLEYFTQRGERYCYRILARTEMPVGKNTPLSQGGQVGAESLLWSFLISFAQQTALYPVLIKYYPPPEDKKTGKTEQRTIFEIVVETRNLGLVMIRVGVIKDGYDFTFLVENKETGEAFEEEVRRLIKDEGQEIVPGKKLISWSVYPVKKEVAKNFSGDNIILDAHV